MLTIGMLLIATAGGWFVYNMIEDRNAGVYAGDILVAMNNQDESAIATHEDYSTVNIEDEDFCGRIIIEKLGVELPVFERWDYAKLKKAPCRYSGYAATKDMIIAAHNYKSHFGNIHELQEGDQIVFVDVLGEMFCFKVKEVTLLDGSAVENMKAGEWDFTLFTCTKGGKQRVTVRCEYVVDGMKKAE